MSAGEPRQPERSKLPRAGILVTGTEVLTGIISDRNGPWLSERLREIGVDAAMIQIVGDRPDDLLATLRFMKDEGMAVIITSGDAPADVSPVAFALLVRVTDKMLWCESTVVMP